ncbi:hypothetical protein F5879DRAFT_979523 [Lentinula edodes]|nr:hypothetical protein F5879DRAFT_979523 [Lentinula edodes]
MRLSIVYFMLGLGLSLLSNVRAMPLSNKGDAMYKRTENNEVFLEFDSELQKDRASILLTSGWPYISKSMPPAMNLQQSNVKVSVGHGHSTSTSLQTIQFKIYADPQLQTLKGYGTIRLNNQVNLCTLRVFDNGMRNGAYIGPTPDDTAQFELRNEVIVVEEKLHEQLNRLSLNHGP